jgi:Mechanosensitive ion channel, conserved TM helix
MWEQAKNALGQSMQRFVTQLAGVLPKIMALVVAIVVSILLAWVLAALVRRLLSSIRFDERLTRWGLSSVTELAPLTSPTLLVSRATGLFVLLMGLLIGIASFDVELTALLVRTIFGYMPNVMGALLVLLVGNIIARFVARSVLIGAVNMNFQYARLLSVGVKWLVMVLTVAMALEHLRIASGIVELAFGILFGGIVLTLALAIAFNSKELVTKSLDRDLKKDSGEVLEDPLRHL